MTNTRLRAKDLPCLFENFVEKYQDGQPIQLTQCETKEKQQWRHASGEKSTDKLKLLAKYFPELLTSLNSLKNYSLCEKHYNQLIANDYFIEHLKKTGNLNFSPSMEKINKDEENEAEEENE